MNTQHIDDFEESEEELKRQQQNEQEPEQWWTLQDQDLYWIESNLN
jgi:hypothetical protein